MEAEGSPTTPFTPGGQHLDVRKRLMRDFKKMRDDPPTGLSATPLEDDIMKWEAMLCGPEETIWEGSVFTLALEFSHEYPQCPPRVRFNKHIPFHPNVYVDGNICVDILKSQWSPTYDVATLLLSIQSLLGDPNPASAANPEAAEMLERNREQYELRVRAIVEQTLEDGDE